MYQTVIVPLDGSPFAAQAVSTAAAIARHCGATLILARVHETYVYEDMDFSLSEENSRRDEEEYLADVAEWVEAKCEIAAERQLLSGPIAQAICTFADQLDQSLIVMSSHGRTGFSRFWLGSVADAVSRHAGTPVLMLRHRGSEDGLATPPHAFRTIMAPLDGSDLAESVLPHVVTLATAFESQLALARVVAPVKAPAAAYAVPIVIPLSPVEDSLDWRVDSAQSYLKQIAGRLQIENRKLEVTTSVRVSDSTAPALLECATWSGADTVALATHGRGASRLLAPSVADKLLRGGPDAVLIVRPPAST